METGAPGGKPSKDPAGTTSQTSSSVDGRFLQHRINFLLDWNNSESPQPIEVQTGRMGPITGALPSLSSASRSSLVKFLLQLPVFFLRSYNLDHDNTGNQRQAQGNWKAKPFYFSNLARRDRNKKGNYLRINLKQHSSAARSWVSYSVENS